MSETWEPFLWFFERRWNPNLNHWGYDAYSGTDGGWEYRRITRY